MKKNFGAYTVEISNEEKIFFPNSGITKGDLINYYEQISDHMLPYITDRPLTMQRFPNGIDKEGFFQKDKPDYFPEWIESVPLKKEDGVVDYVLCNNKATIVYLANQGVITTHVFLSKKDKPMHPDRLIFDLDPPKENFTLVIKGARALREVLEKEYGLNTFLMTTGSNGLHVIIPIKPDKEFDNIREFASKIAKELAEENPNDFTTEIRKDKRQGRLFLDYLRNSYGQLSVAPYSVRALENAPVATPLHWDELDNSNLNAQSYNIKNIFKRLGHTEDPWKNINRYGKSIKI